MSEPNVQPPQAPSKHESLYFADGDLVVAASAAKDNTTHLFRVDTGLLRRHSPVFRDMLAFAPGPEQYDGAPLVRMPDDAEDVAALFGAFYKPGHPILRRDDPDFAADAYGLMKMGRKYQVDSICAALVHHLEQEWPRNHTDLLALLARRAQILDTWTHMSSKTGSRVIPSPSRQLPEPASAIRFALDFDVPSVLPAAFYVLSTTDPEDTWLDADRHERTYSTPYRARWALLSADAERRYYKGKYTLLRRREGIAAFMRDGYYYTDGVCEGQGWDFGEDADDGEMLETVNEYGTPCMYEASKRSREHAKQQRLAYHYVRHVDLMSDLAALGRELASWDVCSNCEEEGKHRLQTKIKELWDDLPKIFDLAPASS